MDPIKELAYIAGRDTDVAGDALLHILHKKLCTHLFPEIGLDLRHALSVEFFEFCITTEL